MANVSLLENSGMFCPTDHSAGWKRLTEHGLILNLLNRVVQLGRWWEDGRQKDSPGSQGNRRRSTVHPWMEGEVKV